ncbi:MAG: Jag N-terminal domain-containing protein [Proteobacteria bacterium]|nr:Jag N-terminal domain-containing protein [Pseudomonadota bacterium]MBU1708602.1 Jag N-terminal domain-containing protein [Pseudomonadota bacterium]
MSIKMEYEGTNIDDAIQKACAGLKVDRENLNIEVLSTGSAGIFGLCRKAAKILVTRKENEEAVLSRSKSRLPEKKTSKDREQNIQKKIDPVVDISQEVLDTIKADLVKLLELMGYSFDVSMSVSGRKALAHISGENLEGIVGPEGQTIDGLQFLLRKIVSRKFEEKIMLSLDAGDYREARGQELEKQALELAEEVKKTGKTATISAINPAERRIVHMVLQNDTTIRSRSVGDGLFKKILIYLPGKGRKKPSGKRRSPGKRPEKTLGQAMESE